MTKQDKMKEKILDYFDGMYACGEWGGESPERDFTNLRNLFKKYEHNLINPKEMR